MEHPTMEEETPVETEPEFEELDRDEEPVEADAASISMLYDLSLPVQVELGRTKMSIQEVLTLTRGSVIELDRLVGEAIDIYVSDRLFAQGEVVVLGEQFGVRITRILTPRPFESNVK